MEATHYDGTKAVSGDELKRGGIVLLAAMHREALEELAAQADQNEDYLDPNSLQVRITVSARAL